MNPYRSRVAQSPAQADPLDWRQSVRLWLWRFPAGDVVLAALFALSAWVHATLWTHVHARGYVLASVLLVAIIAVATLFRRLALKVSFVVVFTALALYNAVFWLAPINLGLNPVLFAGPASLWTVTRWASAKMWGDVGLLLGLVGALLNPAVVMFGFSPSRVALFGTPAVLIIAVTYVWASWLRTTAITHAFNVAAAITQRQLDISRELHDVVGHGLVSIKVQVQTALYTKQLGASPPPEAPAGSRGEPPDDPVLVGIVDTVDSALRDIHALVDSLRTGTDVVADPKQIPELIGRILPPNDDVKVTLPASFAPVESWPLARRLALVRGVMEVATNFAKYGAGRGSIDVSISPRPSAGASTGMGEKPRFDAAASEPYEVTITSSNAVAAAPVVMPRAGKRPEQQRSGAGLVGLKERVEELGGTAEWRRSDEVFDIEVRL